MDNEALDFCVLVTCYNEAESLDEFFQRLTASMEALGRSYEIILVDDGGSDGTFEKMKGYFQANERVRACVQLMMNAGQAAAMTAGYSYSTAKCIVVIDSDLQLAPEEIPLLVREYDKGFDIVSGYRVQRHDTVLRRMGSWATRQIMHAVTGRKIRDFGCTFKLIDRRLADAYRFGPYNTLRSAFFVANIANAAEVAVSHYPRRHGRSRWPLRRLFAHFFSILGILSSPFQTIGVVVFFAAVFVVIVRLSAVSGLFLPKDATADFFSIAIIALLTVCIVLLSAIGELLLRILNVFYGKPAYIIRNVLKR